MTVKRSTTSRTSRSLKVVKAASEPEQGVTAPLGSTTNEQGDAVITDAPEPVKAAPAKPTRKPAAKKAAEAKKAAPKKAAQPLKPVEPKSSYELPSGYVWRYTRTAYDMARKVDATVDGTDWLVVCNTHLTVTGTDKGGAAEQLGRDRANWCDGCKADAKKAAAAAKKAEAEASK